MSHILQDQQGIEHHSKGLPIDPDCMFSNHKNVYKKRVEKRQTKLLEKLPFIKPFLGKAEKIVLVTTGCSPMSLLEQYLGGWMVVYLKRALFVFTNTCIFHIPTTSKYTYRHSIAKILYADCTAIKIKGHTLVVTYKNGQKEKFHYIARAERNKLKAWLKTILFDGSSGKEQARRHLCPRCTEELIDDHYMCPRCNLEFKNKAEGKRTSILYPGGGYFYTRHWWLGIGDAITETALIIAALSLLLDALQGSNGGFGPFWMIVVFLVLEKAISIYHAHHFIKEFIPAKKEITPLDTAQWQTRGQVRTQDTP